MASVEAVAALARARTSRAERAFQALLGLSLGWLLLVIVGACVGRSPEFDGAMNLLQARSIAEGHGPREVYDSGDLFPPGVQTKEPFVLVGALVFKLFGVGPFQIELPNLLYLVALCVLVLLALRRMFDTSTGLLACVALLGYPLILQYALRGYGEVPTLFFGMAALALVAWPEPWGPHVARRFLLAGILAGLALATKVVGSVQVVVVGAVLLCRWLAEPEKSVRTRVLMPLAFVAGVAIPLLAVEAWRWHWLGSAGYLRWWQFQWTSILSQSGAAAPQHVAIATKVARHFGVLATELRIVPLHLVAVLVTPWLAVAFAYFGLFDDAQKQRCRWFLLGLLVLAALYFPWWLAIVPDEKAWLRYLYVALLGTAVVAAIACVAALRGAFARRSAPLRLFSGLMAACVAASYLPIVARAFTVPVSFAWSEETTNTIAAARLVSTLPADAMVFGYGWYAAPSIQIHTDRRFMDLTDWPIGTLIGKPAYLVADRPTLVTGILDRTLARYPHRALRPENRFAQVYAMDFDHPVDPFAHVDTSQAKSLVTFADGAYPLTIGMDPYNPIGGRFVETDSEILLRYADQRSVRLVGYMDAAQPSYYRWPGHLDGRLLIGDCAPLHFRFDAPGWRTFTLPLACHLQPNSNVRVRLLLDNVFDLPLQKDRQSAMLLSVIGFVDDPAAR